MQRIKKILSLAHTKLQNECSGSLSYYKRVANYIFMIGGPCILRNDATKLFVIQYMWWCFRMITYVQFISWIEKCSIFLFLCSPALTLFGTLWYCLGTLEISALVWVHIFICRWDLSYFRAQHSHSIFLFFFASKVIAVEQAVWHSDLKCSGNTILSTLVPHLHSYNVISKPIMCWNQIRNPLV